MVELGLWKLVEVISPGLVGVAVRMSWVEGSVTLMVGGAADAVSAEREPEPVVSEGLGEEEEPIACIDEADLEASSSAVTVPVAQEVSTNANVVISAPPLCASLAPRDLAATRTIFTPSVAGPKGDR